jgi:glucan 1,3-beta-glucosidase
MFAIRAFVVGILASASLVVEGLGTSCTAPLGAGTASPSDPYWMQTITHQGKAAFNANPSSYKVFRNVKDFGAKGL